MLEIIAERKKKTITDPNKIDFFFGYKKRNRNEVLKLAIRRIQFHFIRSEWQLEKRRFSKAKKKKSKNSRQLGKLSFNEVDGD